MWLLRHRGGRTQMGKGSSGTKCAMRESSASRSRLCVCVPLWTSLSKVWSCCCLAFVEWGPLVWASWALVIAAELSETSLGEGEAWDLLPLCVEIDNLVEIEMAIEHRQVLPFWVICICLPFKAWCRQMSDSSKRDQSLIPSLASP